MENNSLTEYETRREGRLEKYLNYLDPNLDAPLSEEDQHTYESMALAFQLFTKFFTPGDVHKQIIQRGKIDGTPYSSSMAYQIISDAVYLFGDIRDLHKEGLRKILTEQIMRAQQMIIQDKDSSGTVKAEALGKNIDRLAKINNLYNHKFEIDPEKLMPGDTYVFVQQGDVEVNGTKNEQHN